MTEARLPILFALLFLLLGGLGARVMQVQLTQHDHWQKEVAKHLQESQLVDSTRGRILDVRGRELAVDSACTDACVDYRAILPPPEEKAPKEQTLWASEQARWIRELALARLDNRLGDVYRNAPPAQKKQLVQDQVAQVRSDIEAMWAMLGDPQITGLTRDQVEETRRAIIRRVQMRRRYVWYERYVTAALKHQSRPPSLWYTRWLAEADAPAPELDEFDVSVKEQYLPHVILPAISDDLANYLGKNADRFPGLSLRRGQHREYPYGAAACHVIGYLGKVTPAEQESDPNAGSQVTRYQPNDVSGHAGMEAFGESALRGQRGEIIRNRSDQAVVAQTDAIPGNDVRLSLDIELQKKIEELFAHPELSTGLRDPDPMHGAAVVIDVPTGEIRALVSYPTYNLNEFDHLYPQMAVDEINCPLMNRATQDLLPPGSTVKPMVDLAALAEGVLGLQEKIECRGYLVLGGRRFEVGKCHDGHAHGEIGLVEALEQSCNVFHETLADRLGLQRLSQWMARFGLGHRVDIGLSEPVDKSRRTGLLPADFDGPPSQRSVTTWFGGMGQGCITATPLQMANVAATIARDGEWKRLVLATSLPLPPSDLPQRVKLDLPPAAIAAVKQGMTQVVEGAAGTAQVLRTPLMHVAGKTGTAQAERFSVPQRDEQGNIMRRVFLEPSTDERVNPLAPWYRASANGKLDHAWFIGFAPAEKPQLAFAVLVEYGGAGGPVAGGIARGVLEAAMEEGYLNGGNTFP